MTPTDENGKRGIRVSQSDETPAESKGRSWFFGIGINEYLEFPPLQNAVKDVKDLLMVLKEDYELDEDHVITLFDKEATRENIIIQLDRLVDKVAPKDKLLLYYSGHGHLNPKTEKGYWIPHDAEKDNTSDYIRNSTILGYLEDIGSLHTLLISDSCFSGSLFARGAGRSGDAADELEELKSRWAICSGRHDEEVYDGEPGANSPFAGSILEVLRTNRKAKLNVAKLADRVVEMTRSNYRQLPEGNPLYGVGHKGGQYVFRLLGSEENFWDQCRAAGTLAAFNDYLEKFPNGKYADPALQHIRDLEEDQEWEKAKQIDRIYAFQTFLRSFPGGKHAEAARERIAALESPATKKAEKKSPQLPEKEPAVADEGFELKKYLPWAAGALLLLVLLVGLFSTFNQKAANVGPPVEQGPPEQQPEDTDAEVGAEPAVPGGGQEDAETSRPEKEEEAGRDVRPAAPAATVSREDIAWSKARQSDEEAAYWRYIEAYPEGKYRSEAMKRIEDLKARMAREEAVRKDERAWQEARDQNTIAAYQLYQRSYPNGKYFSDAEKMIRSLSEAEKAAERPYKEGKVSLGGSAYRVIQFPSGPAWMAENLNLEVPGSSWCFGDDAGNCSQYGRLYTWEAAGEACRKLGWRLPTEKEWQQLFRNFGARDVKDEKATFNALAMGGFQPQIGGLRSQSGQFDYLNRYGYYWTATSGRSGEMINYYFFPQYKLLRREDLPKSNGMSCRCVKD